MDECEYIDKPVADCFEKLLASDDLNETNLLAQKMAGFFSLSAAFGKLVCEDGAERAGAEQKHLNSFFGNLNLLVEKTWVEKVDEVQKRQTLDCIKRYQNDFSAKSYRKCYSQLFSIIKNVMALMFGQDVVKENFLDYAMRIDPEIGLFWWYVCSLPHDETEIASWSDEKIRVVLLVPMFFLANY